MEPHNLHLHHLHLHRLGLGLHVTAVGGSVVLHATAHVLLLHEPVVATVDGSGHGRLVAHGSLVRVGVLGWHLRVLILLLFGEVLVGERGGREARDVERAARRSGMRGGERVRRGADAASAEAGQQRRALVGDGGGGHWCGKISGKVR